MLLTREEGRGGGGGILLALNHQLPRKSRVRHDEEIKVMLQHFSHVYICFGKIITLFVDYPLVNVYVMAFYFESLWVIFVVL